jgi:hypothetical protein
MATNLELVMTEKLHIFNDIECRGRERALVEEKADVD